MKLSYKGALLLGSSLVAALPALAQDATQDAAEDAFDLGEIRIEETEAQSVLGNLEIDQAEIERQNPSTMQDVFEGQTAITSSGGAAIAQKTYVFGIEESLLSVTIDGARQNKSAFHHTGNVLIDPSMLKQVEVTSGLAPADAGPGGLGGSIAYTTRDARDLLQPGEDFGGMFTLSGGDNGFGWRSNLTLFGREGGFEYLLSGTRQSGSDYADGDGVTLPGTEAEIADYMVKLAYTGAEGHRLAFSASQTKDTGLRAAQAGPGGLLFTRPDFAGVNGAPTVMIEGLSRRSSYALTYTHDAPSEWFDPFFQLAYNEQEIDAGGVWGLNSSFSGTFANRFQIGNGTLNAGIDFFDETAEGRTDAPFNFTGTERLRDIGIFAQLRQDLSPWVSVSYGARYDWQEFRGADGVTAFTEGGLSANGAIDLVLNDRWTLNAGLASTWGGYELGEAALINFFGPWTYAGFKPSRSTSGKLGLRFDNGPWQARGAIFRTDIDDIAAVLPSGGQRGVLTDIRSQGFDGSLAYFWASGFARLNYTYADVTSAGAPISSTAYYLGRPMGHQFALEAAWQPGPDWTLGGVAQLALDYDDTNGVGSMTTLPGYELVNLYAEYVPPSLPGLTLRLDLRNLFDETYVARGNDANGQAGRAIALNEPGRTITLTATARF